MNAQLGYIYRDKITGFLGTATGRADYISGCSQILLAPACDTSGAFREGQWFDEQRLEITRSNAPQVVLENGPTPGHDKAAPKR